MKKVSLLLLLFVFASLLWAQDPPSPGAPNPATTPAPATTVNTNRPAGSNERDLLRERIRAIRGNPTRTNLGPNAVPVRSNTVSGAAIADPGVVPALPSPSSVTAAAATNVPAPGVRPLQPEITSPAPITPNPNVAGQIPSAPQQGGGTAAVNPNAPLLTPGAAGNILPGDEIIRANEVNLLNMPLDQVFELYGMYSGRTILRQNAIAAIQITLKIRSDLTRTEVVQALDGILALNGITMIPVGERFVKAVATASAPSEGTAISQKTPDELPQAEQFVTQIVALKTLRPTEAAQYLQSFTRTPGGLTPIDLSQVLVIRDYASNVKRMLDILDKIDIAVEPDYRLEVIPIKYGKVTELFDTMNSLVGGGGGGGATPGLSSTRRTTGTLGSSRLGSGGLNRSTLNRGGLNQSGMTPQQLQQQQQAQGGVGGNQTAFQNRINQIVNRAASGSDLQILGDAKIVPDERSNSLLIYANKRDMEMITNIVARVDTLLAQVLIEAIILEVGLDDRQDIGISYLANKQTSGKLSGLGALNNGQNFPSLATNIGSFPGGFSYFGTYGGTLQAALTAVATDSQANIVSRPRLQTSHAVPGRFAIGETVPYVTSQSSFGQFQGGLQTQNQIQERPIEILLDVVPFITPEGLVVMEIIQKFDSRGADAKVGDVILPIINTREVSSTLSVRDGDTIMLGGFIKEEKAKSKSGIPYLKDIPGLGALFRTKNETKSRKEMIVLMRVTILQTPEKAAFVASEERSNLPGIKQAEIALDLENQKRMKKADSEQRKQEKRNLKKTGDE